MKQKRKRRILFGIAFLIFCVLLVCGSLQIGWKLYEKQDYEKDKAQGRLVPKQLTVDVAEAADRTRTKKQFHLQPVEEKLQQITFVRKQQQAEEAKRLEELQNKVLPKELYVNTTVHLLNEHKKLTGTLAEKGTCIWVTGMDYLNEVGQANMYKVQIGDTEGYIEPKYVNATYEEAMAEAVAEATMAIHNEREDVLGGGSAANLDYTPREKGAFINNVMPAECRTLYISAWRIHEVDRYIELAKKSDINAFVVDIQDGTAIGYAGDVMKTYSPTSAEYACNTVEEYKTAIDKLKNEGFYLIGRITTFNDTLFVQDHPECGISDSEGKLLELSGAYWPSAFDRYTWQYKVDLALEAVDLMGFHEIQFDYVRFPDRVREKEEAGSIEYHNVYGESKAQAIQRFLMYATDRLHEKEVYVAADVFGEAGYAYVTAYGQYWPAISNVVDVICGMPYPDHFSASDGWNPWEHPYQTLLEWGKKAVSRQAETPTPAVVRTWIQAYNAIREPYNVYGAKEVEDQIKGLRDAGCTGGYMTWNSASSLEKYEALLPAFKKNTE